MGVLFSFGFLLILFGIIIALLYVFKNFSSIDKKIRKKEVEVKKKDLNRENIIYRGISLIPDSIFGVVVYILIIFFFIWILGDYGGECGVDYAPRFFGEC